MRVFMILAAATVLAACDSPSVALMGSQKTIVRLDGMTFNVHRRADRIEVYRTGFVMLPDRDRVLYLAELAISQATGCPVRKNSVAGDQALIKAQLTCSAVDVPYAGNARTFDCRFAPEAGPDALICDQV
ncbi:MAG TPA: hypothetical protein ENJ52_02590 [Aliiroseovarius sp.]|nr:hypothetical protein [Aliiroseovarius sp.]